ncbi:MULTISPECIES: hypothetical protein [Streptomyces]|uniref:hypothetical protein n=1 Tax=Streptomyces TaxID=1883 RepID=UPI00205E958E|nr:MULTISPECIES: hypothetical protein [Streptomyces]UPT40217.1 hypothetical protein MWG59_01555 [Streptomyces sp. WAC00303]WIY74503.1 hypothetical protein QPM16_01520 [Streptomyces anulatus]
MNWGYARSWTASLGWGGLARPAGLPGRIGRAGHQHQGAAGQSTFRERSRKSVAAAEASVEEARLSRLASERSATVAEETLADQRREAAVRRAAEEEASRPRVDLRIEYSGGGMFLLFNQGAARAENIRAVGEYPAMRSWPAGLSLGGNEPHTFMMASDHEDPVPAVIKVVWDGRDEPVSLRVPQNNA